MSEEYSVTPMAIAMTVSNRDRSVDFYTNALGFKLAFEREASVPFEPTLQLRDVKFRESFLALGPMTIALTSFESPQSIPAHEHASNQLGIKSIGFGVADLDEAAERVAANGGTVLEYTRQSLPEAEIMIVTDPDGTHLELVKRKDIV